MSDSVDYGPLAMLPGTWLGNMGKDIAPEPDGSAETPYSEVMTFTALGMVNNAEVQHLAVLRYHQVVTRSDTGKVFHDETGYWMWDAATSAVMHSLTIPRAVCVLAGGTYKGGKTDGEVKLVVEARWDDKRWSILQSPFMLEKARTLEFYHTLKITPRELSYRETTVLDIYGKRFDHIDENTLVKV